MDNKIKIYILDDNFWVKIQSALRIFTSITKFYKIYWISKALMTVEVFYFINETLSKKNC